VSGATIEGALRRCREDWGAASRRLGGVVGQFRGVRVVWWIQLVHRRSKLIRWLLDRRRSRLELHAVAFGDGRYCRAGDETLSADPDQFSARADVGT
jgi:hypothetical protein